MHWEKFSRKTIVENVKTTKMKINKTKTFEIAYY